MTKPQTLVAYSDDDGDNGDKYVVPLSNVVGIYEDEENKSRTIVRLRTPIGSLAALTIRASFAQVERDLGPYIGRGG